MRVFVRETVRSIAMVVDTTCLVLEPMDTGECFIEYVNMNSNFEASLNTNYKEIPAEIEGIIGVVEIKGYQFACFVSKSKQVGSSSSNDKIFKIEDVEFICINSDEFDNYGHHFAHHHHHNNHHYNEQEDLQKQQDEHPCHKLKKFMLSGFYYSKDIDLTNTLQERDILNKNNRSNNNSNIFNSMDKNYLWNGELLDEFFKFRERLSSFEKNQFDNNNYLLLLIRGFVKSCNTNIYDSSTDEPIDTLITIISRVFYTNFKNSFGSFGIDLKENFVPNLIETEFLVFNKNFYLSYSMVRGNVPIYYEIENSHNLLVVSNKKINFYKDETENFNSFNKHIELLTLKHGNVFLINALKTKKYIIEDELSKRFNNIIAKTDIPIFNFNKNNIEKNLSYLIQLIKPAILEIGAFCYDNKKKVYVGKQLGIFRVDTINSINNDCGMIEKFINLQVLKLSLQDIGYYFNNELVIKHDSLFDENNLKLIEIYDFSTKKSFNLVKKINLNPIKFFDPIHDFVSKEIEKKLNEYSYEKEISIFIGTFNVNGEIYNDDISSWILPNGDDNENLNDLYIIGLEEVVELTTSKMLITDNSKRNFWENKILNTLNGQDNRFRLLFSNQLGGIVLMMFAKNDVLSNITKIESDAKKTGFGGISANKGGIALSMNYSTTKFCFIVAHLSAGLENVEQRNKDFKNISKNIRFNGNKTINNHDSIIWCGDFNYRISLFENQTVRDMIVEKRFNELFEFDQLSNQMILGESFPFYNEMEIKFPPTYKFNKNTDEYDTSEKMRIPAWTDRILSRGNNLNQIAYNCDLNLKFSDHKPIYGIFKSKVLIINQEIKDKLINDIYNSKQFENIKKSISLNKLSKVKLTSHGLPQPSSDRSKWWIDGGQSARVQLDLTQIDLTKINPFD